MDFNRADYYEILQVSHNASPEIIKAAYKRLIQIYHPDTGGDGETMKLVNEAYDILGNYDKRRFYNKWLLNQNKSQDSASPRNDNFSSNRVIDFEAEGIQVRPWVRFFAKLIDIYIWLFFYGAVFGFLDLYNPETDLMFYISGLALWPFAEALSISSWGFTPGKWILNTRVLSIASNHKISFRDALLRSLWSFAEGLGFGLPIVYFITSLRCYSIYMKNGITPWDRYFGINIIHRDLGFLRTAMTVIVFWGLILLQAWGNTL